MSVFICWSGKRSHKVAQAVQKLLQTLSFADVFVSDDIEKGVAWFESIVEQLRSSEVGIVCLTPENLENPWLHFEAGALTRELATLPSVGQQAGAPSPSSANIPRHRLFPLVQGATGAELKGPLSAYQATSTTQAEMNELVWSIAHILGKTEFLAKRDRKSIISAEEWNPFQAELANNTLPIRALLPHLDSLFQRKSFDEPLHHCVDQAWLRRYDGTRLTHDRLNADLWRVRAACSAHEHSVFEMLLAEVDGYAMAIQALLLTTKKFELGDPGELKMDEGIRKCCEDRRLAIKSLAGLLRHDVDRPQKEEALRFMAAETNEERKMIVHRLEGEIRRQREALDAEPSKQPAASESWNKAIDELTRGGTPITFRASSWDLDRIFYYLLIQYFGTGALTEKLAESPAARRTPNEGATVGVLEGPAGPADGTAARMDHHWLCAARDVEMEVERYRARSKGGSLMPLTYALVALQALEPQRVPKGSEAHNAVRSAVTLVKSDLKDVLTLDAGRPIDRLLDELTATDPSD